MRIVDPALAEYLARHGILWRKWTMRDLNDEEFHYPNTPELKHALAEYFAASRAATPRPGRIVTLGELFMQSAA